MKLGFKPILVQYIGESPATNMETINLSALVLGSIIPSLRLVEVTLKGAEKRERMGSIVRHCRIVYDYIVELICLSE